MKLQRVTIIALILLPASAVCAQPGEEDPFPAEAMEEMAPAEAVEETAPAMPEGDIVFLTTGKQIEGIQVLRESAVAVHIQVLPGMDPLVLPQKIVQSIVYDDIDPNTMPREEMSRDMPGVIAGKKVSKKFHDKLTKALYEEETVLDDRVCHDVLNVLSQKAGVNVEVSEKAKAVLDEDQPRNYTIAPGMSLLAFLQTELLKIHPRLKVTFQYQKIRIGERNEKDAPDKEGTGGTAPESNNEAGTG
jgi:hypothetical protein